MLSITTLLLILTISLLCVYTLHKVRLVHLLLHETRDQSRSENAGLFRQLEALHGLYVELGLDKSLPGTRGWAASPDFLMELVRHARTARPACIVECSSGTSTLVLARCAQMNGCGKVYSLEHDADYAIQTRAQLQRHGLSDWAVVLDAPLQPHVFGDSSWPWYALDQLSACPPIDLLVIDGPPQATRALARYPAGPALFLRLAAGARVFLDDASRDDEQAILLRWQTEFPWLQQTFLPCEKGCAVLRKPA
ncbi:class I SAM-dependent methyltransferase [Oxalobacteraceae bacterium]|nr:class I SAM-dependent methyltransferase [Oxalobacteraceae bacterium]